MIDEEAFAETLPAAERVARGAYFTPAELVDQVLALAAPVVDELAGPRERVTVIDPACGAGAFLAGAAQRWPRAKLRGVEVDEASAGVAASRVPKANIAVGDALTGRLLDTLADSSGLTVWVGNPPYNGSSALLRSKEAWARACTWLDPSAALPKGTSLRDDFVFFLLKVSSLLEARRGVLAFVTSATLLDAFQHAPIRQTLLKRLALRQVVDLGSGAFRGTRVKTCVTVWSTASTRAAARFVSEAGGTSTVKPVAPDFSLRPAPHEAEALNAEWAATGLPLDVLVPVSFAGLKTRFDELLVDERREVLLERVRAFVAPRFEVDPFVERFGLPRSPSVRAKLLALRHSVEQAPAPLSISPSKVRRFHRYRGPLSSGPAAWCYLERALIPRGDHRLCGHYDPHAEPVKLVFNVNELPLSAAVLTEPGCVTAYRHSRFAPLWVPQAAWQRGRPLRSDNPREPLVLNLANEARLFGEPRAVFERIAQFVRSAEVQNVWAPAFGTRRVLPVPFSALEAPLPKS